MLIKSATDIQPTITRLEGLLPGAPPGQKKQIEEDLRRIRAGAKGEREAAYLIDFDFKASRNTAVIHDLRLEINGRVAQIDHLLIHRTLNVYVLESKHFHAGLKITDDGEFLRWNEWKKTFEGMLSPLAQNERHIAVLKEVFNQIEMPTRLGMRLSPTFTSLVMVSAQTRIDGPKNSTQLMSSRQMDWAKPLMRKWIRTAYWKLLAVLPVWYYPKRWKASHNALQLCIAQQLSIFSPSIQMSGLTLFSQTRRFQQNLFLCPFQPRQLRSHNAVPVRAAPYPSYMANLATTSSAVRVAETRRSRSAVAKMDTTSEFARQVLISFASVQSAEHHPCFSRTHYDHQ